jgi:hypothetical protein
MPVPTYTNIEKKVIVNAPHKGNLKRSPIMTDFHAFEHVGEEASLQTSPKLAESRRANLSLKEKATIQKFANVLHRGNLTRSSTTSYPNWIHAE